MEKWIIIDGNSIANRAFYAMPPLTNSQGLHTNAVYGFMTMLLKLLEEEKPTHILVAFDAGKVTFRHTDYKDYKGGRAKTPSELSEQFPLMKEMLQSFGIAQFELSGYEADDIIGTVTRLADDETKQMLVVTGDKDMLQLATDQVTIVLTRKGVTEIEKYDPAAIKDKYQLTPEQIVDLKGLMGDTSDNIPGVPGVGEKTALKLLAEYGSVENVLDHVEELKGKMKENVQNHADDARMSKQLATIFREVPMEVEREQMKFHGIKLDTALPMLRKLEFKSVVERIEKLGDPSTVNDEESAEQMQPVAALSPVVVEVGQIHELISVLEGIETIVVEAHGENPHAAQMLGMVLATEQHYYYLDKNALLSAEAKPIRDWLGDKSKSKQGFDMHRIELILHWLGIAYEGTSFDVQLAAYVLDPSEANTTVQSIAAKYELPALEADEDVFGKGAKFRIPEASVVAEHAARKAQLLHQLVPLMEQDLERYEMSKLYYDIELPLSAILAGMEKTGIRVDASSLEKLGEQFTAQIEQTMERIFVLAGMEFNIGSPKQLGEVLFDTLGLPVVKKTKTGYSTDAEVLEKLEPYHPVIPLILHYRTMAKLQSTYIEGLLKEIRKDTGRIHTYYRQTIAATGRLSSQFPNLQNIPIRIEEGRQIRQAFVPTEPEWSIVAADYSQIELRVLAHISDDANLKEAFIHDMDIHTKTAMDVFGVQPNEVDSNMRRQAKAVNFGIVYGISDYGLSQNLNISRKDAAKFIEQYFAVFQGVRTFMEDVVKQAKVDGYVKTLLERRRYLPEIHASNFNLRSFAERTAMNTPIQGTAADIIKLAMVKMDSKLKQMNLKSRMLLQVHDELVFEVPADEVELMTSLVPEVMEDALKLHVPLKADVSVGSNWYEAK